MTDYIGIGILIIATVVQMILMAISLSNNDIIGLVFSGFLCLTATIALFSSIIIEKIK